MKYRWFDSESVEQEIQKLVLRANARRRSHVSDPVGISYSDLFMHQKSAARRLTRSVHRGEYRFGPVYPRKATVNGSIRTLYRASVLDTIVLSVLAHALSIRFDPYLPQSLYSYRKGRSSWQAALDLTHFLRKHRQAHPNVQERGLYAIRRDIRRYGESIPIDDSSLLWSQLEALLTQSGFEDQSALIALLKRAIRPRVVNPDGTQTNHNAGVPTGSPLQPVFNNLYLAPLDRALESITGAFYVRFGDDILFLHPDPRVAKRASEIVDEKAITRGLEVHPEKRVDRYFNGAGRNSSRWQNARGTSVLEYLGFAIHFRGTVALKTRKQNELFNQLKERWTQSDKFLKELSTTERLKALCGITNRSLHPFCLLAVPMAATLYYLVNDRGQLKDIDYRIASELAQRLVGIRGVRAFRKVSYRQLRQDGGLISLVKAHDRIRFKRSGL